MTGTGAVEELLRALAQRDGAAAASALEGGRIEIVPLDVEGPGGTEGKQYFTDLLTSFPELEVDVRRTVSAGPRVLVELVLRGTPKEPYLDIPVKDGKALESRQAWRVDLAEDGSIASLRVFFCLNEVKWSLGANKTYAEAIAGSAV